MFYRVMVGIFTLSLQQLCGANYFFYYGTTIFTALGSRDSFATSMILSGVNCGCTLFGMYVVNRIGRRILLFWGAALMLVSFLIFASLGSFALYTDNNDPNGPADAPIGRAMIFFACLYIFGFATTWAPLAFVVVSEIFPQRIRPKGMALGTSSLWLWNLYVCMYVCMYEICFYSCLLSYYMLINVDYTITYFLPIPSTVPRTRARSELLNVSLVPPRVEFYTALPVSIVGRY